MNWVLLGHVPRPEPCGHCKIEAGTLGAFLVGTDWCGIVLTQEGY